MGQLAIYHLRLKVISRALGRAPRPGGATRRSVIAAAAYRTGERLYDVSQGRWFQYENDVVHTEILAADHAPSWVFDRQTLWNQVDRSEKRVDAQLAREIELTLPRELSRDQQVALVRGFTREHFVGLGMVADVGIHCPKAADGRDQPHAHILLTLRRLDPEAPTGFAAKKERDWNEREDIARVVADARKRFNNTRLPEDREALQQAEGMRNVNRWREAWALAANRALEDAGSAARIDHRTLEAQGIFRAPQINLGIARHVERAYDYIRERVTQWVSIKKRADLYAEVADLKRRDPVKVADWLLRLSDMAEGFTTQFRRAPDIPEVPLER